jgi:hypothetical protein
MVVLFLAPQKMRNRFVRTLAVRARIPIGTYEVAFTAKLTGENARPSSEQHRSPVTHRGNFWRAAGFRYARGL